MKLLLAVIDGHEGLASRRELLVNGVDPGSIDLAAWYGRQVIRVRKGWYSRATERRDVIRAWRIGGRLTCVSAAEFHDGLEPGPVLHVEVPVAERCGVHGAGVPHSSRSAEQQGSAASGRRVR